MKDTLHFEVTMHNARSRLLSGLAGATLFLFAATSYGQTPNTPTATPGTGTVSTQTTPAPTGTATDAAAQPTTTDAATTNATVTRGTATDVTTTTTRSFPGGTLGIVVVAVVVLLLLFSLFRGRDRTVVRETYASSSTTAPGTRTVSTGTATDDRMNLNSRAASGPDNTTGGMNDPNARR
jgi:hypothetical protein